MTYYSISSTNLTGDFESLGLGGLNLSFVSLGIDTARFTQKVTKLTDGTPRLSRLENVKLYRNVKIGLRPVVTTKIFEGVMIRCVASANGQTESISYEVLGPWYYLRRLPFTQQWQSGSTSRVWLFVDSAGVLRSVGTQLEVIVQNAIDKLAPIQLATDVPLKALYFPIDFRVDQTCEGAIQICLEKSPGVQSYFDYSTTPPTLHFTDALTGPSETVSLDDGYTVEGLTQIVDPVSAVQVNFERWNIDTGTGQRSLELIVQAEPTIAYDLTAKTIKPEYALASIVSTIQLDGQTVNSVTGTLITQDFLPEESTWWETHNALFADPIAADIKSFHVQSVTDDDGNEIDTDYYTQELLEGSPASWMRVNGVAVSWVKANVEITVTYDGYATTGEGESRGRLSADPVVSNATRIVRCSVKLTNAITGDYSAAQSIQYAEPIPTGFAKFLYDSFNFPQWQATLSSTHQECADETRLLIGRRIILDGVGSHYSSTVGDPITSLNHNIDAGIVTAQIGWPRHMQAGDLMSIFRLNRTRSIWMNPTIQGNSAGSQPGDFDLGESSPVLNSEAGDATESNRNYTNGRELIKIDTSDLPTGKVARFRATDVCVGGAITQVYVLRTDP